MPENDEEPPIVRLFRDALESVVAPAVASEALFEALDAIGGELPHDERDLLAVARGPLHDALARHLGDGKAQAVVTRITEVILTAEAPTGHPTRPQPEIAAPTLAFDEETTARLSTPGIGDAVMVIASGQRLATQLRTAHGPRAIAVEAVSSATRIASVLAQLPPAIVVVDATDYPSIDPEVLAGALAKPPPAVVRVIWGSDLDYGQRTAAALERSHVPFSPVDRHAGLEPLADLVRSRSSR